MIPSWRWYGPQDPITLRDIAQAGATGIVNALHELKCGELWTTEAISARKRLIEWDESKNAPSGLSWVVVESVPVHEDIKRRSGNFQHYIDIYKQNLRNLAAEGITCVCYNFMPILDWTRTQLDKELSDGSTVLYCDQDDIALFDLYLLKRTGAEADYSPEVISRVQKRALSLSEEEKKNLEKSILLGLPGTVEDLSLAEFQDLLSSYSGMEEATLRANLYAFLNEIMPVCEEVGILMAIHPDDPPAPIFGLPRIMSHREDMLQLIQEVPSSHNGFTLCTGSLGGRKDNIPHALMEEFAHRVFFAHFRNTRFEGENPESFRESETHLCGHTDMIYAMKALLQEESFRATQSSCPQRLIPVRPDHGKLMDMDKEKGCYAGYSFGGRLIGLTELKTLAYVLQEGDKPLVGKVAVVTGAAGVLCSVLAQALLKAGAKVALLGRTLPKLEALAESFRAQGLPLCLPLEADVLDKASLDKAHEQILARWGKIDILVNGAGGNDPKATSPLEQWTEGSPLEQSFFGLSMEGFEYVNRLNIIGTILPSQVFGKSLLKTQGSIVNLSSMAAFQPLTKVGAYGIAKAGVDNFTAWLSTHLALAGVRVNAIAPGFFITEQNRFLMLEQDGITPTARGQKVLAKTPMRQFGKPENLVGALLYLVSAEARFVTGIVLPVDGGFSSYSGV